MTIYVPRPELQPIAFGDSPSLDAFSRGRVSLNHVLHASSNLYSKNPLFWDESLTGGATAALNTDRASVLLSVSTSGDAAIRQTRQRWRYLSGQGQQVLCTFVNVAPETNVTKRVGYFDADDGIFLEGSGGAVKAVVRSYVSGSPVDNAVAQASWNIDSFDGTGPSGITLDFTKAQILVIDFQWLGVGRVRLGFDVDGVIYYAHEFLHANVAASVYMSTPTLPIRYEITSNAASATGTFEQICSAVNREGGGDDPGILTTATTGLGSGTANTSLRTLLSVRLKSDHIRGRLVPLGASIMPRAAGSYQWQLLLNPTPDGALTWNDLGEGAQYSLTQQTFSGGHCLMAGHAEATAVSRAQADANQAANSLFVGADLSDASDILCLVVQVSSGTPTVDGTIEVLEQY